MEFLTPITALIAAGIAIPALVVLYFLKLKRREVPIPSTLLWKRAVQDLQVNAPFRRLRRNLLLLVQLLTLLLALLALSRPVWLARGGEGKRYVILIDRSSSMNAKDVEGRTRLEEAKAQAKDFVKTLRGRIGLSLQDRSDKAMVIAFDDHAKVLCNFTADKSQLAAAIGEVEATDAGTSLTEAVTVARAFAQSPGEEANNRSAVEEAQLVLFSDGKIRDLARVVTAAGQVEYHCIGESTENVAVVAMEARRSYDDPEQVTVFAALANYAVEPAQCDVQLSVDGNVRAVRTARIPARASADDKEVPGKVTVNFGLKHAGAAELEVRMLKRDVLYRDNAAWSVLPPPRKLSVLLVSTGNPAVKAALNACSLARLDEKTPAEFEKMDQASLEVQRPYDVIILDRYAPADVPRGQYIALGPPAGGIFAGEGEAGIGVAVRAVKEPRMILDWRDKHPVLQYVSLGNLYAAAHQRLTLPRDSEVLAEFSDCPAMALVHRRGSEFLLVAFDAMETNWPFEASFVLFFINSTRYLGAEIGQAQQRSLPVGSALTVQGGVGGGPAKLTGPDELAEELPCDSTGKYRYPGAFRAGVYTVAAPQRPQTKFAVNQLDPDESDIRPQRELVFAGQPVTAESTAIGRTNLELWPLLTALVLVLACVEWLIYNSKARI